MKINTKIITYFLGFLLIQFENFVKSITLVDIPNQEGSISKEEFKKKLGNKNINTAGSIEESLLMNNKDLYGNSPKQ